jgi:hypothetical protein
MLDKKGVLVEPLHAWRVDRYGNRWTVVESRNRSRHLIVGDRGWRETSRETIMYKQRDGSTASLYSL